MKAGVVLNPVAGGGMDARARARLDAALAIHFAEREIRETQAPGDGEHLAMALAAQGCDLVIAVGGDGTASEVADGLIQTKLERGSAPCLAVLPWGAGADFARGLGLSRDKLSDLSRIASAVPRSVDAGRITFVGEHGALARRYFINIASVGLSAVVARAVNRDQRKGRLSAATLYYWRTVSEFMRYRFQQVRISVDGQPTIDARIAVVAACNGRYFGGSMMIAPDAEVDDGMLDIVIVRASGKLGLIRDIGLLYGGAHRNHPAVTILRGRKVTVEPLGDAEFDGVLVEADGETLGRCPVTIEVLPGALSLRS